MAISRKKKLRILANENRKWLIIGGDSSLHNHGKVIGRCDTEVEARTSQPLFARVRPEEDQEVIERLERERLAHNN